MKSNICEFGSRESCEELLNEVEKTADYCGLTRKEGLWLRLLAEEMTGMTAGILGDYEAKFWIDEKNRQFDLHLELEIRLNDYARKELLKIASSGKNEAEKGLMGKIRAFFEQCMDNYDETGEYCAKAGVAPASMIKMYSSCCTQGCTLMWNLQDYEKELDREAKQDELERSIVAKLADDVKVKIQGHQVDLTVRKQF